jgi:hypothetical protein
MSGAGWRAVTGLAMRQGGLVTVAQLKAAGLSRSSVQRETQRGRLLLLRSGVYRVAGAPPDPSEALRAVLLARPDAVASHRSAASLWALIDDIPEPEVTLSPAAPKLRAVILHRGELAPADVRVAGGMRVTSPARTIVDLAAVLPANWVERLLHDSVMRQLCLYEDVRVVLERIGGRGRAGTAVLREMLADTAGDSPLEARWHRLLCAAGLAPPARQYQVVVGGQVFVLDFAWPDVLVAVEVDGYLGHRTRQAFDRDRDKAVALRAAGWTVLPVTSRTDPDAFLPVLRRFIGRIGLSM